MFQLYFLSILCNGLAGFLISYGDSFNVGYGEGGAKPYSESGSFRLVLGILAAATGFLKLLAPVKVPILGDLVPAIAGLAAGFLLLYGFHRARISANGNGDDGGAGRLDVVGDVLLRHRKPIGIACMAAAALHFLFPTALFL